MTMRQRNPISRSRPLAFLCEPPLLHKGLQSALQGSLWDLPQSDGNVTASCILCTSPHEVRDCCRVLCNVSFTAFGYYSSRSIARFYRSRQLEQGIAPFKTECAI